MVLRFSTFILSSVLGFACFGPPAAASGQTASRDIELVLKRVP
jgi:hypothetical protein